MPAPYDLVTVMLTGSVLHALLALVVWIVLLGRHSQAWPVRLWSLGSVAMAAGMALITLRPHVPAWATFQIANLLTLGSYVLRTLALRFDLERPQAWRPALAIWAAAGSLYLLCLTSPDPLYRVGFMYAGHATGAAVLTAHALQIARARGSRNARLLALTEGLLAVAVGFRLVAMIGGWVSVQPMSQSWDFVVVTAAAVAAALFGNLGYVGLVLDRSHAAEAAAREASVAERLGREAAEASAAQLRELLQQRNALAEQRDRLLRVLAHEVRQPLHNASSAMQSAVQALQPGPGSDTSAAVASRLHRAQAVLAEVRAALDNTLAAAMLLSQRGPVARQEVDIDLLAALAIQDLDAAQQPRVRIERRSDLRRAEMDHTLMRLALRNLLRNAFVHGGAPSEVTLRIDEDDVPPALVLEVLDDGPGLPAATRAALSAPLQAQAEPRADQGLGLFIVRQVLALHGGRLELRARTPHGLCARMVVPQDVAG